MNTNTRHLITDHDPQSTIASTASTDDAGSITPDSVLTDAYGAALRDPASATTTHLPQAAVQHRPEPGRPRRARVIAVANQKGGSGKTSSVLGLAGALADEGHDVLIIDIDEQGNATQGIGCELNPKGTFFVFEDDEADPIEAILETRHEHIHLMPAHSKLAEVPTILAGPEAFATERILSDAIDRVRDRYDFILIDCPPSLQIITINGLYAADEVLVPVNPGFFDLLGLKKLDTTVKRVRTKLARPDLYIRHVIVINFNAGHANSRSAYAALRGAFGDRVIDTAEPHPDKPWYGSGVPTDGKISSSHSAGTPITAYNKRSRATKAYRAIATVVKQRGANRG